MSALSGFRGSPRADGEVKQSEVEMTVIGREDSASVHSGRAFGHTSNDRYDASTHRSEAAAAVAPALSLPGPATGTVRQRFAATKDLRTSRAALQKKIEKLKEQIAPLQKTDPSTRETTNLTILDLSDACHAHSGRSTPSMAQYLEAGGVEGRVQTLQAELAEAQADLQDVNARLTAFWTPADAASAPMPRSETAAAVSLPAATTGTFKQRFAPTKDLRTSRATLQKKIKDLNAQIVPLQKINLEKLEEKHLTIPDISDKYGFYENDYKFGVRGAVVASVTVLGALAYGLGARDSYRSMTIIGEFLNAGGVEGRLRQLQGELAEAQADLQCVNDRITGYWTASETGSQS